MKKERKLHIVQTENLLVHPRQTPAHSTNRSDAFPWTSSPLPLLSAAQRQTLEQYLTDNWQDILDLGLILRLQTAVRWEQLCCIRKQDVQRNVLKLEYYQRGFENAPEPDNWDDIGKRGSVLMQRKTMDLAQLILQNSGPGIWLFAKNAEKNYNVADFQQRMAMHCARLKLTGSMPWNNADARKESRHIIRRTKDGTSIISIEPSFVPVNMTVEQFLRFWGDQQVRECKISYRTLVNRIDTFHRSMKSLQDLAISEITEQDICRAFIEWQERDLLMGKMYKSVRAMIRQMFLYARSQHAVTFDIRKTFATLERSDPRFRRLESVEEKPLIADKYIPQVMQYLFDHGEGMLDYGLYLGFREDLLNGELACLKCNTIFRSPRNDYREVYIGKDIRIIENTNRKRVHIMHPDEDLVELIWEMGDRDRTYLFEDSHGQRIPALAFDRRLQDICNKICVPMLI